MSGSTVPASRPSEAPAIAALTVAAVVWGGSIVFQKLALASFSAVETSVFRGLGALAVLIPLWWWQEGGAVRIERKDWGPFALLGLGVLGNHLLTLFGLRYIGAAAAGVIIGASPVITAFLSSLILADVPFRAVAAGCALSFAGVALVSGVGGESAAGSHPIVGGLLVLLGLVSWALYSIGGRRVMETHSPLLVNWTTLLISIIPQLLLLPTDQKFLAAGSGAVPLSGWWSLAYLILFATALGQQAWLYGVKGIGPSRAGVFVNLIPVSALLLSVLVLGESIGLQDVLGILLILSGVWLVNWQSARLART